MKPYFAKYLPVEGEIKEGSIILLDNGTPVIVGPAGIDLFTGHSIVKLFLCSRDIQVGDKIKDENDLTVEYELNNISYLNLYKEKELNYHFKVIGEISPDATWVKEGDEFQKDEIKLLYKSEDNYHLLPYDSHHKLLIDANLKVKKGQLIVEIKGPCNVS